MKAGKDRDGNIRIHRSNRENAAIALDYYHDAIAKLTRLKFNVSKSEDVKLSEEDAADKKKIENAIFSGNLFFDKIGQQPESEIVDVTKETDEDEDEDEEKHGYIIRSFASWTSVRIGDFIILIQDDNDVKPEIAIINAKTQTVVQNNNAILECIKQSVSDEEYSNDHDELVSYALDEYV